MPTLSEVEDSACTYDIVSQIVVNENQVTAPTAGSDVTH